MHSRLWFAVFVCLLLASPAALHAQIAPTERSALEARTADVLAVLQQKRPASDVFNAFFLSEVPAARLAGIIAELEAQHGKLTGARLINVIGPGNASLTLYFERADAAVTIAIEPMLPRKVTGLQITGVGPPSLPRPPIAADEPGSSAPLSLAEEFAALPGSAGFMLARLDAGAPAVIDARRPGQLFAVGSAFKLWVLDAVAADVAAGRLKWGQVVRLGPRSLPSGMTQDWPPGAAVTVETLATLMISISDNTATDALIRLVGRERVEARVAASGHSQPVAMRPLLTTVEAFQLKLGQQAARDAYARSDIAGRRRMLAAMPAAIPPSQHGFSALAAGKPVAIDSAEWFASPGDIVRILDALRRRSDPRVLAILGVSPGMSPDMRRTFAAAGYKGGSEPGVLNYSWLLRRPSGTWYAVTVSWNNPAAPVDARQLEALAQRLIDQAR